VFTSSGSYITRWGGLGTEPGQFWRPWSVAVDASGHVYVADVNNSRIQEFTSSGGYMTEWGGSGAGPGQFDFPVGVAVDASGHVYVADMNNNRIQVFGYGVTPTQPASWGRIKALYR